MSRFDSAPQPLPRGIRLPLRSAPAPPNSHSARYGTPIENDLFGDNFSPFEKQEKKKPPPRPPPPKISANHKPDLPARPAHFNRRPTVLNSLMAKRTKLPDADNGGFQSFLPQRDVELNVAPLIDLSSPSSSPTLTTRSNSDGLSVDSFGSDATSSTGNGNNNTENSSQAESGFEDDFDPFSPPKNKKKLVIRPVYGSDFLDPLCNGKTVLPKVQTHSIPTIIRAKPARPAAPKNSTLLTLSIKANDLVKPIPLTLPVQNLSARVECENGEYSPPMPSIPPPPPPVLDVTDVFTEPQFHDWELDESLLETLSEDNEPYAVALFDFPGLEDDDLPFKANDKIRLLKEMNNEWLRGKLRSGMEGIFPKSYVDIKIPLARSPGDENKKCTNAIALYDFIPQENGDLRLKAGCKINVLAKLNEDWLYGEVDGERGQFPSNFIDSVPSELPLAPS